MRAGGGGRMMGRERRYAGPSGVARVQHGFRPYPNPAAAIGRGRGAATIADIVSPTGAGRPAGMQPVSNPVPVPVFIRGRSSVTGRLSAGRLSGSTMSGFGGRGPAAGAARRAPSSSAPAPRRSVAGRPVATTGTTTGTGSLGRPPLAQRGMMRSTSTGTGPASPPASAVQRRQLGQSGGLSQRPPLVSQRLNTFGTLGQGSHHAAGTRTSAFGTQTGCGSGGAVEGQVTVTEGVPRPITLDVVDGKVDFSEVLPSGYLPYDPYDGFSMLDGEGRTELCPGQAIALRRAPAAFRVTAFTLSDYEDLLRQQTGRRAQGAAPAAAAAGWAGRGSEIDGDMEMDTGSPVAPNRTRRVPLRR
eukprot:TRINITY_DN12299_c0_g1_i1.p1 TRINITY_DN12299_c0_g1~~TRINITY_DN12299_c0_g1_i1.p1  ORF type:complete len:358 (+),score=78.92 TRINITY_DN12299_c0_g1_i1:86-1159(+)